MSERLREMKITAIDFYKGVAICLVVMIHTSQMFELIAPFRAITKFGDMGCQIFFTISSFCLCLSYNSQKNYSTFIFKRLKRIAPDYWIAIVMHILIAFLGISIWGRNILGISLSPFDIVVNFALLNGILPPPIEPGLLPSSVVRGGWFVGTIVILYAFFPILYTIYKKFPKSEYVLCFCVLVFFINMALWYSLDILNLHPRLHFGASCYYYFSFVNQMPSFVLGVYMYNLYRNQGEGLNRSKCFILFLVFFSLLLVFKYNTCLYSDVINPFLLSLSFVYLFEATRTQISEKSRRVRIFTKLGKCSYIIYLLNGFIAWEVGYFVNRIVNLPDSFVWIVWFPISISILYRLSIYYSSISNFGATIFNRILICLKKKN